MKARLSVLIIFLFAFIIALSSCVLPIPGGNRDDPNGDNESPGDTDNPGDTNKDECKHNFTYETTKEASCTEKGKKLGTCSLCEQTTEKDIPAIGHDMTEVAAKAPTCTEDGWDAYEKCSRCEETTYEKKNALGHDIEQFPAKLPTESEVGWDAYEACKRCNYSTYIELPATNEHMHAYGAWETFKPSGCVDKGIEIRYCLGEDCDASETREVDPLGHDENPVAGKVPTLEEIGWEDYTVCERCDEKIGYKVLPKRLPEAEILPVKGGADGIVVIIHDDGNLTTVYELEKIFYKYGLVGTLGLMSNNGKTTNNIPKWNEVLTTGRWKVASHSATHTWWGIATPDGNGGYTFSDNQTKVTDEIVNSQAILRNLFPGQRVLTFIFPGFASEKTQYAGAYSGPIGSDVYNKIREFIYSPASRALIEEYYIGARYDSTLAGNEANVDNVLDYYYMNGGFISNSAYTGGSMLTRLDNAANGGFEIFSLHTCAGESSDEISPANMDAFCKKIAEYVADGKVWNTFYEDAILYTKEAQSAKAIVTSTPSGYRIILSDELDDEIYNYPLTVRMEVPKGWVAAKIAQGELVTYAKVKTEGGRSVIDTDIIPNGESAFITSVALSSVPEEEEKTPASPVGSGNPATPPSTEDPETPSDGALIDKSFDFSSMAGITVSNSASKAEIDNGTLKLTKNTGYNEFKLDLGKSISNAGRIITEFDIMIPSGSDATTGIVQHIYFGSSSPYIMVIDMKSDCYYLGDKTLLSGGSTQDLFKASFDKWYNVKVDINISGTGILAKWTVTDESGEKKEYSSDKFNLGSSSSPLSAPMKGVSAFMLAAPGASLSTVFLDDLSVKVYEPGKTPDND